MKLALAVLMVLIAQTAMAQDVCDDILDALGIEPDTTVIECPVGNILLLKIVPGETDTLIITADGDTLDWPISQIPELEIRSFAFGMKTGNYLKGHDELPWGTQETTTGGTLAYLAPRGYTWISRIDQ